MNQISPLKKLRLRKKLNLELAGYRLIDLAKKAGVSPGAVPLWVTGKTAKSPAIETALNQLLKEAA